MSFLYITLSPLLLQTRKHTEENLFNVLLFFLEKPTILFFRSDKKSGAKCKCKGLRLFHLTTCNECI